MVLLPNNAQFGFKLNRNERGSVANPFPSEGLGRYPYRLPKCSTFHNCKSM